MSTGVVRTYHDNEQTKLYQEYFTVDGLIEGQYKSYNDESGLLWSICNYINGKREGEYKMYWETGQLKIICYYINGKREGDYYFYNKKAELTTVCKYLNDIKIN